MEENKQFGADDLYAAYCLKKAADHYEFGKRGSKLSHSRGQTRYMFYMVAIELLDDILISSVRSITHKARTRALLRLFESGQETAVEALLKASVQVIDDYLSEQRPNSVF